MSDLSEFTEHGWNRVAIEWLEKLLESAGDTDAN